MRYRYRGPSFDPLQVISAALLSQSFNNVLILSCEFKVFLYSVIHVID